MLLSGEQPSSNTLGLWTKEVMVAQNSSVTAHMDKCNDLANRRRLCHSSHFLFALWFFLFLFFVCQHSDLSNLWLFTCMWFYCISMNQNLAIKEMTITILIVNSREMMVRTPRLFVVSF